MKYFNEDGTENLINNNNKKSIKKDNDTKPQDKHTKYNCCKELEKYKNDNTKMASKLKY